MGADVVIAVHLREKEIGAEDIQSMFDVLGRSMDLAISANEARGLAGADLAVSVDVSKLSATNYAAGDTLIAKGSEAAAAAEEALRPFALDDVGWTDYLRAREARRRHATPRPQFVRVRSYRDRQEQVGEDFGRAENYLSLVGLVIVVLGGIAVSSVTRVFVRQKIKSIAVMKCVGGTSGQILSVYLVQSLALGVLGSVMGVTLAALAIAAIPNDLNQIGTLTVSYGLSASAVAQGMGIGVLVSLLFALVPLLEVRQVKPSLLLRQESLAYRWDWLQIAATIAVGGALVALASWQAASLRIGLGVCVGFVGLTVVLHLVGMALTRSTAPLARSSVFALRHAVLHLARPGSQMRVILLTVGLGTFFIMGVRGLQVNLLEQFAMQIGDETPDLFLLDIQQDQAPVLQQLLSSRLPAGPHAQQARVGGDTQPQLIPVLRARVTGRGVNLDEMEDLKGRGLLSREYTITYRGHLEPNEICIRVLGDCVNGAVATVAFQLLVKEIVSIAFEGDFTNVPRSVTPAGE